MSNWIKASEKLPEKGGKYLIAWRLCKEYQMHVSLANWTPDIAHSYPFEYDTDYIGRTGGGWVISDSEEDYEMTGVEYWTEIPELPEEER